MHFNLPEQLATQVASYDKTRKKLAATMAAEDRKAKKKTTCPNGRPSNMIPADIVNDQTWDKVVQDINASPAANKVQLLTKPVLGEQPEPIAVVYYHKQLWVAAWLPKRKDDGYIYGITIAYKDTAEGRKQCTDAFFPKVDNLSGGMFDQRSLDESKWLSRIKDGRTYWHRKTVFFTLDEINNAYAGKYWYCVDRSHHNIYRYGSSQNIYRQINVWEKRLMKDVPVFLGGGWSEE